MTIGKLRTWLYFIAKLLGDVNAVRRGRVRQRVTNRIAGRIAGRALRRMR